MDKYTINKSTLVSLVSEVNRLRGGTNQLLPYQMISSLSAINTQDVLGCKYFEGELMDDLIGGNDTVLLNDPIISEYYNDPSLYVQLILYDTDYTKYPEGYKVILSVYHGNKPGFSLNPYIISNVSGVSFSNVYASILRVLVGSSLELAVTFGVTPLSTQSLSSYRPCTMAALSNGNLVLVNSTSQSNNIIVPRGKFYCYITYGDKWKNMIYHL